jgi:hypothetical protein
VTSANDATPFDFYVRETTDVPLGRAPLSSSLNCLPTAL